MTWRRLGVLIRHLPKDSATVRSVAGDAADWTTGDYLLAVAVDHLAVANWQRSSTPKKPAPRPKPVPRPKVPDGRDATEIRSRLLEQRARIAKKRGTHGR